MEPDRVYLGIMIDELIYHLSGREIPKLYTSIIWSWGKQSCIRRKLARSNSIVMRLNWVQEFVIGGLEHFQILIITTSKQQLAIEWKVNRSHRTKKTFNDLWMSFHSVVPDSDGVIPWAWGNHVSSRSYFDIIYRTFMSNESERSHGRFEVPHHHGTVFRARHNLFKVRVECNFANFIFMTLKGSFKSWISLWVAYAFLWHWYWFKFKLIIWFWIKGAQFIWI